MEGKRGEEEEKNEQIVKNENYTYTENGYTL